MGRHSGAAVLLLVALLLVPSWPARAQPGAPSYERPVVELRPVRDASDGTQSIPATPSQILSRPDAYDGQVVCVQGVADSLKHKVSRKGNPYTTFHVTGFDGTAIKAFSFSHLPIRDRQPVEVTGTFKRVKRVGRYVFYNEIDASEGLVRALG